MTAQSSLQPRSIEIKAPESQEVQACRLLMAQAYVHLWEKAYDALLFHGVNYRSLPEYKDQTLLDEARKVVLRQGRAKVMLWIERVEHGIEAAIRRKQIHLTH